MRRPTIGIKPTIAKIARALGRNAPDEPSRPFPFASSLTDAERDIIARMHPYSITSPERLIANADAARYVVQRRIPGAIVECGVWRGGSLRMTLWALKEAGVTDRHVFAFDTFEGMTPPTSADTSPYNEAAPDIWQKARAENKIPWEWYFRPELFSLEQVEAFLNESGYPSDKIHLVAGPVEETLPDRAPDEIALLRLDTDWYASTRHELVHLYPRLSRGGVLIVDDYGHWDGCRRAVDEYFATCAEPVLLTRIDYSGRIAIKH